MPEEECERILTVASIVVVLLSTVVFPPRATRAWVHV
jgi:hypothetical protein